MGFSLEKHVQSWEKWGNQLGKMCYNSYSCHLVEKTETMLDVVGKKSWDKHQEIEKSAPGDTALTEKPLMRST